MRVRESGALDREHADARVAGGIEDSRQLAVDDVGFEGARVGRAAKRRGNGRRAGIHGAGLHQPMPRQRGIAPHDELIGRWFAAG